MIRLRGVKKSFRDAGREIPILRGVDLDVAEGEMVAIVGPSGFVMRSLVERVIEPAARLTAISLRADLAPGALLLTLDVEAAPGAER